MGGPQAGLVASELCWSAVGVAATMGVALAVAVRTRRHRGVDVAWASGFFVVAIASFVASSGSGDALRRDLVLGLVGLWSLRLGGHLAWRQRGEGEDPRYERLLARVTHHRLAYAVATIYVPQGLGLLALSMPIELADAERAGLQPLLFVGVALYALGMVFEAGGDWQLARFRAADPGAAVLERGLWRYTRHPNYFGESCIWWGIALCAAVSTGAFGLICPALLTVTLVRGTGKALLEKHLATTRPAYASYVESTSGFIPLPRRRSAKARRRTRTR